MDKVLDLGKRGWHPEGTGSIRGDVKSWIPGKGKQSDRERAEAHVSQPLSSLKDPQSFGAPPKNANYYGGGAGGSPARAANDNSNSNSSSSPVVLDQERLSRSEEKEKEKEEESKQQPPPVPYRVNTTGLSTDSLPKPPIRRINQESPHGSRSAIAATHSTPHPAVNKSKPSLPPRLPREAAPAETPARGSVPDSPPPPYDGATGPHPQTSFLLNQDAMDRLSKAGVKVPGLGIGGRSGEEDDKTSKASYSPSSASISANVSELQSRFAKLNSSMSHETPATPTNPSKKPPLPPKRQDLHSNSKTGPRDSLEEGATGTTKPPPVPLGTKPK